MKRALLALALFGLPSIGALALDQPAPDQPAPAFLGRWLTEPRDGIIEIAPAADGSYQGKIIGGSTPTRVDAKNPDPSRRQRLLLGQTILVGMRPEGDGAWSGGTIYEPDTGRTYKCRIELIDRDHLKVRGFIGIALLGRSQTWTRFTGSSLDLSTPAR
jgi:uncharacterized protein (DUF2147 family)